MPLPEFIKLHPEAKVTPEELATLKGYLAPWTPAPNVIPQGSSSEKIDRPKAYHEDVQHEVDVMVIGCGLWRRSP